MRKEFKKKIRRKRNAGKMERITGGFRGNENDEEKGVFSDAGGLPAFRPGSRDAGFAEETGYGREQ